MRAKWALPPLGRVFHDQPAVAAIASLENGDPDPRVAKDARAAVNRHRVEYGENAVWTAPAGAARWLARRKTALHDVFGDIANLASIYGGEAPTWIEFGGYDIAADEVIAATDKANDGLESVATAAGATVPWITLTDLADGLDTEIAQFIAYDGDGRAMQIDRFAVPAPNATDASTIAAQERRLLQTLLLSRERAAGQGGVRKADYGEGIGEEFESLAVFDRRIAETRARIAWFEQAAEGNALPRAEYW